MAYLNDPSVAYNIPRVAISILRGTLGSAMYEFEESKMLDFDMRAKLKQLSGKRVIVRGTIANREETVLGGMQSLKRIEFALGTKMRATVSIKARVSKILTDQDIDTITEYATTDEGFSAFTFQDEMDADKEIIDVINQQARLTTQITLTKEEQQQPDIVWQKLCGAFITR